MTLGHETGQNDAHNNIDFGLSLTKLIWDFGKSRPKIEAAKMQHQLAILNKDKQMQQLALQAIRDYYMTLYARKSIDVKERQIEDYAKMLHQTEIRRNAGSATDFDYLNTNAGFNAVKTALIALNMVKEKQYVNLSLLADTLVNDATLLSASFMFAKEVRSLDELIATALANRTEMKIVQQEYQIAQTQYRVARRNFNPSLQANASMGGRNNYVPSLNEVRFNYSLGASLRIPLFESGLRHKQIGRASCRERVLR